VVVLALVRMVFAEAMGDACQGKWVAGRNAVFLA
jgi:hypothetical protein